MYPYTDIIIYPLFSSTEERHYLLFYNERYYEVSYAIVELVIELQEKMTIEEAALSYIKKKKQRYSTDQVVHLIDKFVVPIISLKKDNATFLYEKELFAASIIDKFSDVFRFLFRDIYMWILLILTLLMDIYFFVCINDLFIFDEELNAYCVIGLIFFMLLSSFFHELGHASACKYFGLNHGGIGFGLYLNFPVFYTDVTSVWKLTRKQRLVVNIAGVYFQSLLLIILLTTLIFTHNKILWYLSLLVNFSFLMTLNPFFKFDGYWIMSDLLGVPNLRTRSKELISYFFKRIRGQSVKQKPYLLLIRRTERYGLFFYSIIVNSFMVVYFIYIIPNFIYHFLFLFPHRLHDLYRCFSEQDMPSFALIYDIGMQLMFFCLIGFLVVKLIMQLKKDIRS